MNPLTEKQKRVLAFVQRMLSSDGRPPTQEQMAEEFGVSRSSVRDLVSTLVGKGYLEYEENSARGLRIATETLAALGPDRLPLIGRIAAGGPLLSDENVEAFWTVDHKLFRPRAHFLRRVQGSSMRNANIFDGDLVALHQIHEALPRQIVAVQIEQPHTGEFELTLKRFTQQGRYVVLMSENDDQDSYPPIRIDPRKQRYSIEGLLVGSIRTSVAGIS